MAIAVAQFTIFDFHDVQASPAPPLTPVKEQIWLDTSVQPPFMKVWDGNRWVTSNDFSKDINDNKTTIQTHSTDLKIIKGNISTLIQDTTISKDGKTTTLKDDYNRTVQTVNSINSTLGSHSTKINEVTGKITSVDTKVNSVQRDLESTKISISSNSSKITDLNNITKSQSTDISLLKNQISLKVEKSDIEKSINETQKITDEKISSAKAEIKITTDSINQTVSNLTTTVSTKADNSTVTNVSNKVSSLETNLNSITGKVSNLETSVSTKADKSTTYTKTETDALIKVKTDEINLNLTKNYTSKTDLTDAINNIEIGGRNLLFNSGNFTSISGWDKNGGTILEVLEKEGYSVLHGYGSIRQPRILPIEPNTEYIYSCEIMFEKDTIIQGTTPLHFHVLKDNSGNSNYASYTKIGLTPTTYPYTVKANAWFRITYKFAMGPDAKYFRTFLFGEMLNTQNYWLKNIQLEKGNKLSNWSPAPEDFGVLTDEKISNAKAEIKITTDAINQTVSNLTTTVSTKADNSTVTNVSNKVSSLETNLNSIKGEVSSLETTTTTISNNVNTVKNTANDALNKANNAQSTANSKEDKNDRAIFARGTGNDYPGNAIVKIGNNVVLNGQNRGLNIIALDKISLDVKFKQGYDTFGDSNARTNFTNKIEELNNGDFIIIVTSQDASYPLNVRGCLEKIGATLFTTETNTYREAYALIGKSRLGKGNGIEMFIPKTANDKRYADVLIKVNEYGAFLGANSNNAGDEINSLTTEVTTVKSSVATLDVTLKGITQRVSSTESTTVSLTNQVNKAQNDANTANNKIDSLDIGGRNLARNTSKDFKEYKAFTGIDNVCPELAKVYLLDLKAGDDIYITLDYEWENIVAMSGRTPKAWTQGSGDVTSWNAGSFPSSAGIYTMKFGVGSGSDKVQYKVTLNAEHVKNSFWTAQVRHDGVQSGIVRWKNFKVEKGNKPTDWSPAPEDIDSAINSIDNKVTTTNNKVASIETNLNSITSRVSNVETTTSNINGQVNNLSTRMNSAEIKLSDSSIINTISSQFYKKGETNSIFASKTELNQTVDSFNFSLTKTGGTNEILNSKCLNSTDFMYTGGHTGSPVVTLFKGKPNIQFTVKNYGSAGGFQTTSFPVVEGEKHTLAFEYVFERAMESYVEIHYYSKEHTGFGTWPDIKKEIPYNKSLGTKGNLNYTTTVPPGAKWMKLYIYTTYDGVNTAQYPYAHAYIDNLRCFRGDIAGKWCPSSEEMYTANIKFNRNGIEQTYNNKYVSRWGADALEFKTPSGVRKLAIDRSQLCTYNFNDGNFLSYFGATQNASHSLIFGNALSASRHCAFFDISHQPDAIDDSKPITNLNSYFRVNFFDYDDQVKGIHINKYPMYVHQNLYIDNNAKITQDLEVWGDILNHGNLDVKRIRCRSGIDMVNMSVENAYAIKFNSGNGCLVKGDGKKLQLGGQSAGDAGGTRIGVADTYGNISDTIWISAYNFIWNKADWNWGGKNIYDVNVYGTYTLTGSPGGTVGADAISTESMLLQEDFSSYDDENNAVVVNINEAVKSVYENNKKLENKNEQLKIENKNLKEELAITKNALDTMLMN